jgi:ABC-type polysaccharide/polyol phosphate export permease
MFVSAFKCGISLVLVFVLMIFFKVPFPVRLWQIVPEFLVLLLFTYGLALFLMHVGVYVKDMNNVINVLLRLVFYLSGVFYDISSRVPAPWNTYLSRINPVSLVMSGIRNSLLYGKDPDWLFLGIWFILSLLMIIGGLRLVYRWENNYAKVA